MSKIIDCEEVAEIIKYKEALEAVAKECESIGNSYLDVGMVTPGSVYLDVATRLRKLKNYTTVVLPKARTIELIFSHKDGD